jgi:biotin carboxyl carrier protein
MPSPDHSSGQEPDTVDARWRAAEDLIDWLDRQSRQTDEQPEFALQLAESLRQFSSARGVSIRSRSETCVKLIAKSGVSVFPLEQSETNPSDDLSISGKTRLDVNRPLTATSVLEIELCFDQPIESQQERLFKETTQALIEILLPVVLRSEIDSLTRALRRVDDEHQGIRSFYAGATVKETYRWIATTLASLTQTDRVSIIRPSGTAGRLVATSVPSDIDPRSQQTRLLGRLIRDTQARNEYINQYSVQEFHIEFFRDDKNEVVAAIVFEQYREPDAAADSVVDRFAPYEDLTRQAIQSAVARELATPRSMSNVLSRLNRRDWAKIAVAMVVACLALFFVKVPMQLTVPGRVVSASKTTKYSPAEGYVTRVFVSDGDRVTAGMKLMELYSPELEMVSQRLSSELATTNAKIDAFQSLKRDAAGRQASAEVEVLKTEAAGLRLQLDLVRQQQQQLIVRSSQEGVVHQWDATESLVGRVVVVGQPLMQIIDPSAGWKIELDVPDQHIGYLTNQSDYQRPCRYRLRASPTEIHLGRIANIDRAAKLNEKGESIVHATIEIDSDPSNEFSSGLSDEYRRGASVIAKVDCGYRSSGFVVFRGLIEWWRGQVWI